MTPKVDNAIPFFLYSIIYTVNALRFHKLLYSPLIHSAHTHIQFQPQNILGDQEILDVVKNIWTENPTDISSDHYLSTLIDMQQFEASETFDTQNKYKESSKHFFSWNSHICVQESKQSPWMHSKACGKHQGYYLSWNRKDLLTMYPWESNLFVLVSVRLTEYTSAKLPVVACYLGWDHCVCAGTGKWGTGNLEIIQGEMFRVL